MAKATEKAGQAGRTPQRSGRLTAALLLGAAAAIAATVYVVVWPPWGGGQVVPSDPGPSISQRMRRVLSGALAQADALPPSQNPARRRAYEEIAQRGWAFLRFQDRNDILVRPVLAAALLRLERTKEAEQVVDDLLHLAPGGAEGLCLKGELLRQRDDNRYVDYYRRAAEAGDAGADAWAAYGREMLLRGHLKEAARYLDKAHKAALRSRELLRDLADLAMRNNDFARAEELIAQAMGGRADVHMLGMLAEAQKNAGRPKEAEATIRRALAMQRSGPVLMELGEVLLLQRRTADAADAFAQAAEFRPFESLAALKAARCYYLADRYALAMKYIDVVAARHGEEPEVRLWLKRIEDARFGRTAEPNTPAIGLPKTGAASPASPPATMPGLLGG